MDKDYVGISFKVTYLKSGYKNRNSGSDLLAKKLLFQMTYNKLGYFYKSISSRHAPVNKKACMQKYRTQDIDDGEECGIVIDTFV